jgi:hypothetical protein
MGYSMKNFSLNEKEELYWRMRYFTGTERGGLENNIFETGWNGILLAVKCIKECNQD